MGQYYKAVIKEKGKRTWKSFDAWTFDSGAKLVEHSYVRNPLVLFIKDIIFEEPTRVVWAGDYKEINGEMNDNLYSTAKKQQVLTIAGMETLHKSLLDKLPQMKYLVNESKKQFVDYSKVPTDKYGYTLDPMPILCADNNGAGGGDYYGINKEMSGLWSGDLIYVDDIMPEKYKEIEPNFILD